VTRGLVVSVHDVAPPTQDRVEAILSRLTAIGVTRRSLLVIPNFRGEYPIDEHRAFCQWLRHREAAGDDIVLHGYEHVGVGEPRSALERFRNRWFTDGEGEFLSLEYDQALDRLRRGRMIFGRAGFSATGFVAPAWLINRDGLRAARDLGFAYTNSYLGFTDLQQSRWHAAPSLVFGPGRLDEDLGLVAQRRLSPLLRRFPVIRVVLHPPCVDHQPRMQAMLDITARQIHGRTVTTYSQLLEQYRMSTPAEEPSHAH
jgi:predicted deacetylase